MPGSDVEHTIGKIGRCFLEQKPHAYGHFQHACRLKCRSSTWHSCASNPIPPRTHETFEPTTSSTAADIVLKTSKAVSQQKDTYVCQFCLFTKRSHTTWVRTSSALCLGISETCRVRQAFRKTTARSLL